MNTIEVNESVKKILSTLKDELLPTINDLNKLIPEVYGCRVRGQIFSEELRTLLQKYERLSTKFFEISNRLETPDLLFMGMPDDIENMKAYFQYEKAFKINIQQGFQYIEVIDRSIDRKLQDLTNMRTLLLAIIAIIFSFDGISFRNQSGGVSISEPPKDSQSPVIKNIFLDVYKHPNLLNQ